VLSSLSCPSCPVLSSPLPSSFLLSPLPLFPSPPLTSHSIFDLLRHEPGGSVVAGVLILPDKQGLQGASPASIARQLAAQAADPASPLFAGALTRHTRHLSILRPANSPTPSGGGVRLPSEPDDRGALEGREGDEGGGRRSKDIGHGGRPSEDLSEGGRRSKEIDILALVGRRSSLEASFARFTTDDEAAQHGTSTAGTAQKLRSVFPTTLTLDPQPETLNSNPTPLP